MDVRLGQWWMLVSLALPTAWAAEVLVLQEGSAGYSNQVDLCLNPAGGIWSTDARLAVDASPRYQTLVRFDEVFGSGPNQVPPSAVIVHAALKLTTGHRISAYSGTADDLDLYRIDVPWTEESRWGDFSVLNDTIGVKAHATWIGAYTNTIANNEITSFDITAAAVAWHTGVAANHGILLVNERSDGCDFWSDASPFVVERPVLEIHYVRRPALVLQLGTNDCMLTFQSQPGYRYQCEWAAAPEAATWAPLGDALEGDGTVLTNRDTRAWFDAGRFYRLSVLSNP